MYYIAVAAEGNGLKSRVSGEFAACKYLLIVDMDTMGVKAIKNDGSLSVEELANRVLEFDCEAIITGELKEAEFNIFADNYVTRFIGAGHTVAKALELMERNSLELIRNLEGTATCGGDHHHDHHHHHD